MNRRSLIKCILGLTAAPKILAEIDFNPPVIAKAALTKSLVSDLQLLTPQFYKSYIDKYGSTEFTYFMEQMGKAKEATTNNFFWFERSNIKQELNNG